MNRTKARCQDCCKWVLEAEVVRTPELNLALCRDCQPNHPDLGEYDSMASLVGQGYELSQRDKRLASFARVWLALESEACGVTGMGFDEHVEFDWFKMETNQHANGNYLPSDKVLLDMIKAQGQVEGHVFPDQIRDTLRVMLHG